MIEDCWVLQDCGETIPFPRRFCFEDVELFVRDIARKRPSTPICPKRPFASLACRELRPCCAGEACRWCRRNWRATEAASGLSDGLDTERAGQTVFHLHMHIALGKKFSTGRRRRERRQKFLVLISPGGLLVELAHKESVSGRLKRKFKVTRNPPQTSRTRGTLAACLSLGCREKVSCGGEHCRNDLGKSYRPPSMRLGSSRDNLEWTSLGLVFSYLGKAFSRALPFLLSTNARFLI